MMNLEELKVNDLAGIVESPILQSERYYLGKVVKVGRDVEVEVEYTDGAKRTYRFSKGSGSYLYSEGEDPIGLAVVGYIAPKIISKEEFFRVKEERRKAVLEEKTQIINLINSTEFIELPLFKLREIKKIIEENGNV